MAFVRVGCDTVSVGVVGISTVDNVIRATSNDRDFWKEDVEDKVADFRNVRQVVNKLGGTDRSRSRRRGRQARADGPLDPPHIGALIPSHSNGFSNLLLVEQDDPFL